MSESLVQVLSDEVNLKSCLIDDILQLDKLRKNELMKPYVKQIEVLFEMKRSLIDDGI